MAYPNITHIVKVKINNSELRFEAHNFVEDDFFVNFTDKFGKNLRYNKSVVTCIEEVSK